MTKKSKLEMFKFVANAVVGAGTSTITRSIIANNVAPANLPQQISVGVASLVIGSMAASATREHTSARIDQFVEQWNKATAETKSEETPNPA